MSTKEFQDDEIESNWDQVVDNFENMDLKPELLRGIYAYGLERPSAIQRRAIVPVISDRDIIAQALPGTGKTTSFAISILQKASALIRYETSPVLIFIFLDENTEGTQQVLILAPTRELAQQIQKVVLALGEYMNIKCHACIGGTTLGEDMAKLREGAHVIAGTPGRVFDMIRRRVLRTNTIKIFCLVETDKLLSCGFKDQVYKVFQRLPQNAQVALHSDTMPTKVLEVTKDFVRDPVRILARKDERVDS
ncbi:hypothetical protein D9756_007261 [Leucocoprinus leucothites]|uniref:RNA helicase n=1 Tax=Leucocoprinus leucothites TaxID=201217 RepID=A0A8H5D5D1_9AGAR|nr:hypothetical protein D9756_007261 [Leucoagaricus leucothites]